MSRLARWLARLVWGHMLWTMRRPRIKRLRRKFAHRPWGNERVWNSIRAQDKFARRYGLRFLTGLFSLVLASIALTLTLLLVLRLFEAGAFTMPERSSKPALNALSKFQTLQTEQALGEALDDHGRAGMVLRVDAHDALPTIR